MAYLTTYRLLAISLTGLAGWIIYRLARSLQPSLAPAALLIWLWCPMTLFSTAVGGHNDLLMIVLILAALWLLQKRLPLLSLIAMILAAHVKLTALIWLPAILLWILWRWGWKATLKTGLAGLVIAFGLSWLLYAPFDGWSTLPRMLHERALYLANSFWRVFYLVETRQWGWTFEYARRLMTSMSTGLSLVSVVLLPLWLFNFRPKRWRLPSSVYQPDERILWAAMLGASLLYLLLGAFWFQHWYLLWVIAPAALLPDRNFARYVLPWLCFGALASNLVSDFLWAAFPDKSLLIPISGLIVAMIWLPALIATLIAIHNTRSKHPIHLNSH